MEKFVISLVEISEKEFYLAPQENLKVSQKKLNLGFSFEFKWEENTDFIEIVPTIVYLYIDNQINQELMKFKTVFKFQIKNLKNYISIDKEKINIPDSISNIIISTSISSMRGMLYYKTSGTYMSRFLIPLLDSKFFVNGINEKNKNIDNLGVFTDKKKKIRN
ncbi:hypothetical protein [Epilithonimonas sp. UC225_85]|uniref:hypothetical protein n=1 Tax=Epilithonimonas sp. UC225_85 TaxID=3350167 RepID=UPI0036D3F63F